MKNYLLTIINCFVCALITNAQCLFDFTILNNLNNNPNHKHNWELVNEELSRNTSNLLRGGILIPVVVHVVWRTPEENISDAQILSQISILNRDFNGWNNDLDQVPIEFKPFVSQNGGIRFCLVSQDSTGKPTRGIVRKQTTIAEIGIKDALFSNETGGSTAWQPNRILNIWVANTSDKVTGIGSFPLQNPENKDGIVVHPRYFGRNVTSKFGLGRVAVHEAGHYFGLQHLWGIRTDTSTCGSDGIDDTPPQRGAYKGCPTPPQYSCGKSNMLMNFMDYTDDPCLVFFTKGQMERMLKTIQLVRKDFLENNFFCDNRDTENILFKINPNPVSDNLILTNYFNQQEFSVFIYNNLGQIVLNKKGIINKKEIVLNLNNLQTGFYVIQIVVNNKPFFAQKIIKY